jgi:WD40 repeat protein
VGAEIIVVASTEYEVIAFRGDQSVTLTLDAELGSTLLGKADALIVLQHRFIFVHQIATTSDLRESLPCTFKIPIDPSQHFCFESAAWSSDMTQFGYCAQEGHISIWNLYDRPSSSLYDKPEIKASAIQELKIPSTGLDCEDYLTSLAFNDSYAACSAGLLDTISVFDRRTGSRLYKISAAGGLGRHESATIELVISGHFLISSSGEGCILGVWDLRTGKLSYRKMTGARGTWHRYAIVQLSSWNFHAFVGTTPAGEITLWGFPQCKEDEDQLKIIYVREAARRNSVCTGNAVTVSALEIMCSVPLDGSAVYDIVLWEPETI